MNFATFDINSMMVGKEIKANLSSKKGSENQGGMVDFLSRFERAIEKHSQASGFISNEFGGADNKLLEVDSLENKIDKLMSKVTNPMEFIQALEQIMAVIAKGNLENLKIDPQGLSILKEMLSGAGFSPDDIDQALLKISHPVNGKNIPADKLFKELAKLSPENNPLEIEEETSGDELVFPESMLPVIQSILYNLGIEKNVADDILTKASLKHKGTSLNTLIDQLKNLDKKTRNKIFQTPSGDTSFVGLLEQMGLPVTKLKESLGDDVSMSLNTLIGFLDALKKTLIKDQQTGLNLQEVGASFSNIERPLATRLQEIFTGSGQKADQIENFDQSQIKAALETLSTSGETISSEQSEFIDVSQGKGKNLSAIYHNIKSLVHEMEKDSVQDDSEKTAKIDSGKDLFAALAEHIKVEEKDSSSIVQVSSEELKKNLLNAEKKNQDKAFVLGDVSKGVEDSVDAISSLSEQSGAEGENDKSAMENMLFRKLASSGSKEKESISSQDGVDAPSTRKIMEGDQVKKPQTQARPIPFHVTRQVSKGVLKAIQNGEITLRLQLKPVSLGRLLITIDNLGDSMKVSVMTENQAAKDMLNANVHELKGMLANTGINLEQFDVDMSSDFKQSMANTQQGFAGSGKKGFNNGAKGFDSNVDDSLLSTDSDRTGGETINGSLHYVA